MKLTFALLAVAFVAVLALDAVEARPGGGGGRGGGGNAGGQGSGNGKGNGKGNGVHSLQKGSSLPETGKAHAEKHTQGKGSKGQGKSDAPGKGTVSETGGSA